MDNIVYFQVKKKYISDHCAISNALYCNMNSVEVVGNKGPPFPSKFKWCNDSVISYQSALMYEDVVKKVKLIEECSWSYDEHGVDSMVESLTNVYITAAEMCLTCVKGLQCSSKKVKNKNGLMETYLDFF